MEAWLSVETGKLGLEEPLSVNNTSKPDSSIIQLNIHPFHSTHRLVGSAQALCPAVLFSSRPSPPFHFSTCRSVRCSIIAINRAAAGKQRAAQSVPYCSFLWPYCDCQAKPSTRMLQRLSVILSHFPLHGIPASRMWSC